MATGDVVKTQRVDRYHVEIRHPRDDDWHQIHGIDWETTPDLAAARAYAEQVSTDHPGSQVRLVGTRAVEITKILTGETKTLNVKASVIDHF